MSDNLEELQVPLAYLLCSLLWYPSTQVWRYVLTYVVRSFNISFDALKDTHFDYKNLQEFCLRIDKNIIFNGQTYSIVS